MTEKQEENKNSPVSNSDNWKLQHIMDKKEVEIERDDWKKRYEDVDVELLKVNKKNRLLESELSEWQRKELAGKTMVDEKPENAAAEQVKKDKLKKFLNRIK